MNTHTSRGRRIVAALGAAAIGLVGLASAASATGTEPNPQSTYPSGNIVGQDGSITVHKYAEAGNTSESGPDGTSSPVRLTPLEGVVFTATEVTDVDLMTPEGWDAIPSLTAADATGRVHTFAETDEDGSATLSELPVGVYYIQETSAGSNNVADKAAPFFVTIPLPHDGTWLYDVHVYPKNSITGATKTVNTAGALGLGAPVTYTITVDIPTISAEKFTKFSVVDKLPLGIDYTSSSATPSGAEEFLTVGASDLNGETVTFGSIAAVSDRLNAFLKDHGGEKLTITINGTVKRVGALENKADVTVNDWTSSPSATTRWGGVDVHKTDTEKRVLAGAEFQVFATESDAINQEHPVSVNGKQTFTSNTDGLARVDGLFVGDDNDHVTERDYWIVETKAPAGFQISGGNVTNHPGIWKTTVKTDTENSVVDLTWENSQKPAVDLPLTGANGQLLALIGGGALVLLAGGTALVARRRSHQNQD